MASTQLRGAAITRGYDLPTGGQRDANASTGFLVPAHRHLLSGEDQARPGPCTGPSKSVRGAFASTKERSSHVTAGTLISAQRGDGLALAASGAWTAEHARTLEPMVDAVTGKKTAVRSVAIDVQRIERIDTYGAWLLERALRTWSSQGCETRIVGLPEDYRGLFEKIQAGTHKLTPCRAQAERRHRHAGKRRQDHDAGRRRPRRCWCRCWAR